MPIAELIRSLKSRKQTAERTSFGHYLETVKKLALGEELDAEQVAASLDAAGKDEIALERDVVLQQSRFQWAAQLRANESAVVDRRAAEAELSAAQQKLQAAHDKLRPAVDQAHDRLNSANQACLRTMNADALLAEHVLDYELIEREAAVVARLRDVHSELSPLTIDREHKCSSLQNSEYTLAKLRSRKDGDWVPAGLVQYFNQPRDIREQSARVDDLLSQLRQLDAAIVPRQAEQQRLQSELLEIHQQKLQP